MAGVLDLVIQVVHRAVLVVQVELTYQDLVVLAEQMDQLLALVLTLVAVEVVEELR